MEVEFIKARLKKGLEDKRSLQKKYGKECAKKIQVRILSLIAAENLHVFDLPKSKSKSKPERCHELIGKRAGEFALDLSHPFRLIFKPNNQLESFTDWRLIDSITILKVEDYHGK